MSLKIRFPWSGSREHLKESTPRLILTPELEALIREKIGGRGSKCTEMGSPIAYAIVPESMLELEPLAYKKSGKKTAGSFPGGHQALTTLALVYRLDKNEHYLKKLEEELKAVCAFKDWNPSHFLDVA